MTKKLLSLILTVAFILGCFSAASVSASTIVLSDDDYSKASEVLGALCPGFPLIDEEASSDAKPTTRAEFVAAMAMVMGVDVKAGVETPFSDVDAKNPYASAIKYAAGANLISTVDLFFPDSPITYSQAMKIAMVAAGYGDKAEYTGGYPTGYIKAAKEAGVAQNINLGDTDTLTHAQATQIIFETAICDMLEVSAWGDSFDYSTTEGKNILSVYKKIYMANGVVESNENTTLTNASENSGKDTITIDGVNFYAPGYENLIGKTARVFYGNDNKNSVIYAYENGNEVYNYTNEDALSISGLNLTVMPADGEKELRYGLESDYSVIYNGKFYGSANYNSVINPSAGSVGLVDNDDNNKIDVIIIKDVEYGIIGSVNEVDEKIFDKYKKGGMLDLSDSSISYMVTEADGTAISLIDLESDYIVGYAISKDKKLVEIIHYSERIGGTFDSKTSDGKLELKGKEYQLSSYYTSNVKSLDNIKFGSEIILHLGVGNQVVYIEEFSTAIKYGFVVDVAQGSGLGSKAMVKLFTEDGEMKELNCADKVRFDGEPVVSTSGIKAKLDEIMAKQYAYRVVKYALNADGELSKVFTPVENTIGTGAIYTHVIDEARPVIYFDATEIKEDKLSELDSVSDIETVFASTTVPYYVRGAFNPYFHLGSSAKAMQVPVRPMNFNDEENFSILAGSAMEEEELRVAAYDVTTGGAASFVLVNRDSTGGGSINRYASSGIIESISKGLNEEGEPATVLKLYYGGKWEKYYYNPEVTKITKDLGNKKGTEPQTEIGIGDFEPGDIIRIAATSDRVLTEMTMNFDCSTKTVTEKLQFNPADTDGTYIDYITGYGLSISKDKQAMLAFGMTLNEIDALQGNVPVENAFSGNFTRGTTLFVTLNRNRQTKEVVSAVVSTEASLDSVATYFNSGKQADYLVLRQYYREPSLNIIYVNIDE
jgi:hypothetical protein